MRPPPKRSALATGRNHKETTSNVFGSVTPSARSSSDAPVAVDVARNPSQGSEHQGSSGVSYRIGDTVLVRTLGKPTREATIVEIDPSDASRFNVTFKDKRKKGGWRSQNDLTPLVSAAVTSKNKVQQKAGSRTDAGTSTGAVNETSVSADNTKTAPRKKAIASSTARVSAALVAAPTAKTTAATSEEASTCAKMPIPEKKDGKASQTDKRSLSTKEGRPRKRKNDKVKATDAPAVGEINEGTAGNVGAFGSGASQQGPPPKRATTAMAEKAKSSAVQRTRPSQETRDADRSASCTFGESGSDSGAKNNHLKGKGKAKSPALSIAVTGKMHLRTPGEGWKRPKIVLPGNREGSPEPALRVEHLSEFVRPQKAFKIHQQRVEAKLRKYARTAQAPASTSLKAVASRRPALRRPLCQPSHSLEEVKRGIAVNLAGTLAEECGDGIVDPRRGRRARKQVHPSLSEDKMAAASFGGVESDDDAYSEEEYESSSDRRPGDGKEQGEARAPRFLMSADTPWGDGDVPRIKVTLSLQEDGAPFSADRSAIAVVSFPTDRHHHSGEQLANVLTARKFLCYHNGENRVFVLTSKKEAEQKVAMERVRELALARCGARVETVPWLAGRPALDEFLDNHRLVLRHVVRHRLAVGMWSEVDGVYFNGLFCGRGSKRTFNGVRLGINLAVSSTADLETGVWELWMTVEPTVHRFLYLDWFDLVLEKEDRGLNDFSGSKSDDLERRLQVLCLPNCTRGVVYDVQEDPFEMDRLQENNLKRGYIIGPSSEYEMVEYWRQVHLISIPSSGFGFVRVQIGNMVLTYPSWCVIRRHREIPEATKALKDIILNVFTDALDAMDGITVKETTFVWHLVSGSTCNAHGSGGGTTGGSTSCFDGPGFITATGRVIGERKTTMDTAQNNANGANYVLTTPNRPLFVAPVDANDSIVSTPKRVDREANQDGRGSGNASNDMDQAVARGDQGSSPSDAGLSPGSRAAKAATQAAVALIRRSVIRRRGAAPPRRISPDTRATGRASSLEVEGEKESATRLCSTPFVVKRSKASSGVGQSATENAQSRVRTAAVASSGLGKHGAWGRFPGGLAKGRTQGGTTTAKEGMGVDGATEGGAVDPGTPHAPGNKAAPAQVVTPAAAGSTPNGRNQQQGATIPSDGSVEKSREERKEATDDVGISEAEAPRGECSPRESTTGPTLSSEADLVPPSPATPSKLVVIFVAAGSLGMGLNQDATEDGSVVLREVSPTSAAANVPNGWRITEVGGENVRRLGLEKLAPLLRKRPLAVTFEPPRNDDPATKNAKGETSKKDNNNKVAAPRKRPAAKSKANKPGGKKGKRPAKVTTARKTFKVQSRTGNTFERREEDNAGGALVGARVATYPADALTSPDVAVI